MAAKVERLFTISGISEIFKHDRRKVGRIIAEAGIKPVKIEGKREYYVPREYLDAYMKDVTGDNNEILDYTQERARLAREQRRKTQLEVEVLKKSLIPAEEVEALLGRLVISARAKFLSIPTKAAAIAVSMSETEIEELLTNHVYQALNELSSQSSITMGTAAEAESQSMGGRKQNSKQRGQRGTGPVEH